MGEVRALLADRAMRLLVTGSLINSVGNGVFAACGIIYLTKFVGFSAGELGVGLTVAEVIGFAAGLPIGAICDRYGPKRTTLGLLSVQAIALTVFVFADAFWLFVAAASVNTSCMKGARATNNVLLAQLMASKRVAARALLRSVNNLGVSGGALLGAVALVVNTRPALAAILLADALSFLLALFLFSRLRPTPAAARTQGDKSWAALRDRPFLALTVVNGLMSLQYYVLTLALPLWVVQESSAPDWTFPALLALNTLVVAGGQIRVSRGIQDVPSAVRHLRVAGLVFLGSMALFAVTGWLSGGQAVALLVVAVVLHSVAEIWHASGSFEVSVGLAPAASVGTYQAVYNLGLSGAEAVAPAVVIGCCIGAGTWGWVALGVLFALAGAVTPSVARRAGGNLATT